jgi:hypothetical protein
MVLCRQGEEGVTLALRGKTAAFDAKSRSLRPRRGTGHEVLASELRLMIQTAREPSLSKVDFRLHLTN